MILTTVAEGDDHGVGTSFMKYEVNVASAKRSLRLPGDMDVHQFDFMVRVKNLLRVDDVSDPKQVMCMSPQFRPASDQAHHQFVEGS